VQFGGKAKTEIKFILNKSLSLGRPLSYLIREWRDLDASTHYRWRLNAHQVVLTSARTPLQAFALILRRQQGRGQAITDKRAQYVPSELEAAFDAAWLIVERQERQMTSKQKAELRLALARCLVDLAKSGVIDRGELLRRAVVQMRLGEA
jgi:hypothetical protein